MLEQYTAKINNHPRLTYTHTQIYTINKIGSFELHRTDFFPSPQNEFRKNFANLEWNLARNSSFGPPSCGFFAKSTFCPPQHKQYEVTHGPPFDRGCPSVVLPFRGPLALLVASYCFGVDNPPEWICVALFPRSAL